MREYTERNVQNAICKDKERGEGREGEREGGRGRERISRRIFAITLFALRGRVGQRDIAEKLRFVAILFRRRRRRRRRWRQSRARL